EEPRRRAYEQPLEGGDGRRNRDADAGDAGAALQLDLALEALDLLPYDREPEAVAGDAGDRRRGAEARAEDEVSELRVAERPSLLGGGEARAHGRLADALEVDPATVVLDDDLDAAVLGRGEGERDPAARLLAGGGAIPWSIALRTRWMSGSLSACSTRRSSSSSPPCTDHSISFPCSRARSRTI